MPNNGDDVLQLGGAGPSLEHVEHLLLDVDRVDPARLAGELGQLERVKSVAAAHVADDLAGFDVEFFQKPLAVFFSLTGFPHEPVCSRVVHRRGNFPAHVAGSDCGRLTMQRVYRCLPQEEDRHKQ